MRCVVPAIALLLLAVACETSDVPPAQPDVSGSVDVAAQSSDPCDAVECPEGELCYVGQCVPDETGMGLCSDVTCWACASCDEDSGECVSTRNKSFAVKQFQIITSPVGTTPVPYQLPVPKSAFNNDFITGSATFSATQTSVYANPATRIGAGAGARRAPRQRAAP